MKTLQDLKPGDEVVYRYRKGTYSKPGKPPTFTTVLELKKVTKVTAKRIRIGHREFDRATGKPANARRLTAHDRLGTWIEVGSTAQIAKLKRQAAQIASREDQAAADRALIEKSLVWRVAAAIGWQSTEQAAAKLRGLTSPALRELAVVFGVIEL